jgi:hypothetical protein
VELEGGKTATIGIERLHLHLEQDAGKSLHDQSPSMSFVDLNRSGVALIEIVSKPDIRDAEQAKAYVTKLRSILRYLGTCAATWRRATCVTVTAPGAVLTIRLEDGKLLAEATGIWPVLEVEKGRSVGLRPLSRTEFAVDSSERTRLTFLDDQDGKVSGARNVFSGTGLNVAKESAISGLIHLCHR